MCEELYGHIWWRRGWGEIMAVRKQIPYFCKASLLSTLTCVLFPCSLFDFESPCDVPGEVCQGMGWQKLVQGHGYLWSTVVWESQLPLAVEVGLSPFCYCCCFSFPLYAITFRKQDQNTLGKPNGFWETAALHPKLCSASIPVNLIFKNAGTEFLTLPLLIPFKPLLLELQLVLCCVCLPRASPQLPHWHVVEMTAPAFTHWCTVVAWEFL